MFPEGFGLLSAVAGLVIVSSAICSGTEAALFLVSVLRVRQLAETGKPAARALLKIRENMSRPIASIVIINNIATVVGSMIVGQIAGRVMGTWYGVFSGVLTFLVIIFAEIIPKTLGERYAVQISLIVARPILALCWLLTPAVWLLEKLTEPLTRGNKATATNEAQLRLLAQLGKKEGSIESDESDLIQRVFDLNDRTAAQIMTPRISVTWLKADLTLAQLQTEIIASQHSRIVVADKELDHIVGVAYKEELLSAIINGEQDQKLSHFVHDTHMVAGSEKADSLIARFQHSRRLLAVVINEFSAVVGVVTLEDVIEVLVGEIVDESDREVDLQKAARLRRDKLLAKK